MEIIAEAWKIEWKISELRKNLIWAKNSIDIKRNFRQS